MAGGPSFWGLEIGDWGTWASAIGTAAAAGVALWIAIRDGRQRDNDRAARGYVVAAYLFADVGTVQRALELAEGELTRASADTGLLRKLQLLVSARQVLDAAPLTKIVGSMDKLADLPAAHAVSLASLPDNIRALLMELPEIAISAAGTTEESLSEVAETAIGQVRITKRGIDAFMAAFKPEFVEP